MNFIQKYYLNRQLKHFTENRKKVQVSVYTIDIITSLCLFTTYQSPDKWEEVYQCVKWFRQKGKEITVICYFPFHEIPQQISRIPNICTVSAKDANIFGQINTQKKHQLASPHYDVLIDTDVFSDLFGLYLKSLPNAEFRIGRNQDYCSYFDLTLCVDENHTINDYMSVLNQYTSRLKGN
ncbi:MAG: hypothetical protein LBQ64_00900 [Bacteroidales bacterium]|jgi:hypothetical protein|nr:hypothetical protein [Bacteroidales bacterium]